MAKSTKRAFNLPITMGFACLLLCIGMCLIGCSTSHVVKLQDVSEKNNSHERAYQEIEKDGRLYIFTSLERMASFEKSGEVGKSIIKIGYGPNGETVVFDSDDAVYNYDSNQVRQILDNIRIEAYKEFEKDGRLYVFTSPERKESFEKSGEMGKDYIAKIGYGPNGKAVLFDSHDAIKEYEKHHKKVSAAISGRKADYSEMRKGGRIYVFTSPERMDSFKQSGELGKGIIKVGYGPNGETVVFGSDEAVQEYERRNIR